VLQRSGILQRARYLTSNSGSSWFNVAFSYQRLYSREAMSACSRARMPTLRRSARADSEHTSIKTTSCPL
ncbi:MAG: hypothetical protein ACPIOQ_84265, partial [Promethearchaeia archaeon]